MIRRIIQILLGIGILVLGYLLYNSISQPVKWQKEKERRYTAIKQRLIEIRAAQAAYKVESGHYAATFPELTLFLTQGHIRRYTGNNTVTQVNPADSLFGKGYKTYQMAFVPGGDLHKFRMKVYTSTKDGLEYLEVTDPEPFDPEQPLGFGSLIEPTLRASWEKAK